MSQLNEDHLYCSICRERYPRTSLFSCYNKHNFCKKCFKHEYYNGKQKRCPQRYCESWVSTSSKPSNTAIIHGDERTPKKMIPNPLEISKEKCLRDEAKSITSMYHLSTTSISSLSKKPVCCPHKGCNKTIAVTAFDAHFKYEHKHVSFINTYLDARNGLDLYPDDVVYDEKLCVVLLNILNEENPTKDSRLMAYKHQQGLVLNKPVLIVLATRLCAGYLEDNEMLLDEEEEPIDDDQYTCSPDDKILIWVASTVITKYSYTLAISTLCNRLRVKYYGPLLTINEEPKKLCNEGRGLILSPNHLIRMSDSGQKPLALDIIIHEED